MFNSNTSLQVTGTDFEEIKQNFREFIQEKTEFTDYNFEGSTLNFVLDILAYNTYINAFYTNMAVNENFLDTAQIRSNVVSQAKKLGYIPKHTKSARTKLRVTFTPSTPPLGNIIIPKYTQFTAKKDNITHRFHTLEQHVTTNVENFTTEIDVYQGEFNRQTFTYNNEQRTYELVNPDIDLDTLIVRVFPNATSTNSRTYKKQTNLTELNSDSEIYFVEESVDGNYEIFFGDGILGKSLENGNRIEVEYLVSFGALGNDIRGLSPVGYTGYDNLNENTRYEATNVNTNELTYGGADKEDIDSIKFNAPRFYTVQDRLVTARDYEIYLTANYEYIESLNVWGGEDNIPSIPGRVLMAIKPNDGFTLSQERKNALIEDMSSRNVLSIEPIILDPTFVFVTPTIDVNYTSANASSTTAELFEKVSNSISEFERNTLGIFGNSFIRSKFTRAIDDADVAINNNESRILFEKRFTPLFGASNTYSLNFSKRLEQPLPNCAGIVSSNNFRININENLLNLEDDGNGNIKFFYFNNLNEKIFLVGNFGTVNYETGEILIDSVHFIEGDEENNEVSIFVKGESDNYYTINNQILLMSSPIINMFDLSRNQVTRTETIETLGSVSPVFSNNTNVPIRL